MASEKFIGQDAVAVENIVPLSIPVSKIKTIWDDGDFDVMGENVQVEGGGLPELSLLDVSGHHVNGHGLGISDTTQVIIYRWDNGIVRVNDDDRVNVLRDGGILISPAKSALGVNPGVYRFDISATNIKLVANSDAPAWFAIAAHWLDGGSISTAPDTTALNVIQDNNIPWAHQVSSLEQSAAFHHRFSLIREYTEADSFFHVRFMGFNTSTTDTYLNGQINETGVTFQTTAMNVRVAYLGPPGTLHYGQAIVP